MAAEEAFLLDLCKVLLDEDRLKILGQLAQSAMSGEELRNQLAIKDRDLTRHLQQLQTAGLIKTQSDGTTEKFVLDVSIIHRHKKQLFASAIPRDSQSDSEKTLTAFVKGGVITSLPLQQDRLVVILGWLVDRIPPEVEYAERAINELLKGHEVDHVTLRRLLIDHGFMTRAAGIYRRSS